MSIRVDAMYSGFRSKLTSCRHVCCNELPIESIRVKLPHNKTYRNQRTHMISNAQKCTLKFIMPCNLHDDIKEHGYECLSTDVYDTYCESHDDICNICCAANPIIVYWHIDDPYRIDPLYACFECARFIMARIIARYIHDRLYKILLVMELPIPRDVANLIACHQLMCDIFAFE